MARNPLPIVLMLLAGCARSEDASVVADSNQSMPAIEQRTAREPDSEEIALGEWRDALQEQVAALEFGPTGTPPLFSMRCDNRRGILLQRHGSVPTGDLPTMLVTVGRESRRLAVTGSEGPTAMLRAALPAGDAMIATIAGAAVPIVVRIGTADPLVLPPGPPIQAFVARCTSADVQAAQASTNEAASADEAATAGNSGR